MRIKLILALSICCATPALAQESNGCDNLKWPADRERAALATPSLPKVDTGTEAPAALASIIALRAFSDAGLPKAPERAQKADTFAGFIKLEAKAAGTYAIATADYAWIDVVQNDAYLKPKDHSSVKNCTGLRKIMKFDLAAGPAIIQFSGASESAIKVALFRIAE